MSVTILPVITDEDREPLDDLVKRLIFAQGLFAEDRLFLPSLPAERLPGGV